MTASPLMRVLAHVCSFSAVAGFSVVGFTEVDPFDERVRQSAVQTHRPLARTSGVCLPCPTISPAWVRRGATLGQRLGKTRPQMKLPDFGLNAREAARLSQMKRRDEPLEQEVRGLYILGAAGGLFLGATVVRSPPLGLILGVQLAPLLAFMEGAQGERVRLAGWETWRLYQIQRARGEKTWRSVQREAEARGVSPALRRAWARVVGWNERTGASRNAIALARATASSIERAWARFTASGVARRLGALWQRTTIPRRLEELRQRVILQARIADVRRSDAGGP